MSQVMAEANEPLVELEMRLRAEASVGRRITRDELYHTFRAIKYEPTERQQEVVDCVLGAEHRFISLAWGRQSGKTTLASRLGLAVALTMPRTRGWIVGPTRKLTERAFRMVWDLVEQLGLETRRKNWGALNITLNNGSYIEGYSADDYSSLVGETLHWMIVDEAAQLLPEVWNRALKACLVRHQGWALLIGTFDEDNWYYQLHQDVKNQIEDGRAAKGKKTESWAVFRGATWEVNTAVFPDGENSETMRVEKESMPREDFLAQYGGVVLDNPLKVFKEFKRAVHVQPCLFDPQKPVELAIDPSGGGNPYAVAALQDYGTFVRQIDEFYSVGVIAEQVIDNLRDRPWWTKIVGGIMDSEAPDDIRRWRQAGVNIRGVIKPHVPDRLPQYRTWLRAPGLYSEYLEQHLQEFLEERDWQLEKLDDMDRKEAELRAEMMMTNDELIECARYFVDPKCQYTIQEHLNYKRNRPRKEDLNMKETPRDFANHFMDALGYWFWMNKRHGARRMPESY
ncbi:MAG: terminase family protein [Patescibacteria group bacterium]|nr:terminase family protein [Patescibacteria group bacterium]